MTKTRIEYSQINKSFFPLIIKIITIKNEDKGPTLRQEHSSFSLIYQDELYVFKSKMWNSFYTMKSFFLN